MCMWFPFASKATYTYLTLSFVFLCLLLLYSLLFDLLTLRSAFWLLCCLSLEWGPGGACIQVVDPPIFFKFSLEYVKQLHGSPPKVKIWPPYIILNNSSRVLVQYNFKLSKKLGLHPAPPDSPNSLIKQNYSFLNHRHFQPRPNPKSKIPN